MIASMTGFARVERAGAWGTLVCEIRSVNHRFLDASLRLPDSCRALEGELRQAMAKSLRRGKVDCTVMHRAPAAAAIELDDAVLGAITERSRALAKALGEAAQLNVVDLLRWPGVVRESQPDSAALAAAAQALVGDAIHALAAARAREGERLAELITQRLASLEGLVAQVRARLPEVLARVRARLEERLAELGGELDKERIEQEIVLLLHRLDVDEELDRLGGHVAEARRILSADEAAGRRLDFLLQEFNREANTLSSKSQDLDTTRIAVEMKVVIEQMREQVQNIE